MLPAAPAQIFAQGKQNDVPTLTGSNLNDINGASTRPTINAAEFQQRAKQKYGQLADEFLHLYPAGNDEEARMSSNASLLDSMRVSTYLVYMWDHALPGPDADTYGAFYTSEVPYVMNAVDRCVDRKMTEVDYKIADTVSTYWANFIKTGNPNGAGVPHWPGEMEKPATSFEIGDKYQSIPIAGDAVKQAFLEKGAECSAAASKRHLAS